MWYDGVNDIAVMYNTHKRAKNMKNRKKIEKQMRLLGCLVVVLFLFSACATVQKVRLRTATSTTKPTPIKSEVTGVVVENDELKSELKLRYLDSETVNHLFYDETSVIQNEYGQTRDGEHVEVGEILQVEYFPQEGRIQKAVVPQNAWYYHDVQKFAFDADENTLEFVGRKYQYDAMTLCYSGNGQIQPMDFDNQDHLTIRGIGGHVYSVIRTKGHGYIRLSHYADFVGGMIEIGDSQMLPVKENMLITATEGTYRLKLWNRGMTAVKTIVVENGGDITVDFSDYKREVKDIGEVTFDVRPDGAELTINGKPVDYAKPVTLSYGKYKVKVALAGYETYNGVLSVGRASKTIHIVLVEEDSEIVLPSATPTATPTATANSITNSNTVTRKVDGEHTITVTSPAGAEVYVDGIYKGLVPCTFTKIIGSQTVTLKDSGHITKEYSVDILDDDKDVKLTFAELEDDPSATNTPEPVESIDEFWESTSSPETSESPESTSSLESTASPESTENPVFFASPDISASPTSSANP